MKILIDVNLTPEWTEAFSNYGITALHWSEIGDTTALDVEIMAYARDHRYIVFTHDLDFGTLLFHSRAGSPSVIQLRCAETRPCHVASLVVSALELSRSDLAKGALLTIEPDRRRIRLLPLIKS